jgi:hypothetical protein
MNEKIRTANLPQFALSPKEAIVVVSVACILSYIAGLLVGLFL